MKKYNCLLALLVSVFLLLCACAQQQSSQTSSAPDALSSAPSINVAPASRTPDSRPPATFVPATSAPATSAPATAPSTAPTTAPTQPTKPTEPPPPTEPNLDWVVENREIVPFEDRFNEDVPFGYDNDSWLTPWTYPGYSHYLCTYRLMRSPTYFSQPIIIMEMGIEEDELVYWVPISLDRLDDLKMLSVDGCWGYFGNDSQLCKLDLLTGELTTLATRNEGDIRWEVQACGKDTVCIFQLDAQRNLRIYYRDLHSEAERTVYQGVLPDVPTSENDLLFCAPSTTQGEVYWEMINPAFCEVYLKELSNPNSSLKDSANLYIAVQEHYNIPMLVRYACDFSTGTLTEYFGLYDTCWQTKDCKHDHFDYENTREETPRILDIAPVEISNFSKLTGDEPFWGFDHCYTCFFSDFGYSFPYWRGDSFVHKLADIAVTEMSMSNEYIYCITTEGAILQFNHDGSICNTIYTSENELRNLLYWGDCIYFVDGSTIICIDETSGTWRPILQTTFDEITLFWSSKYRDSLTFTVHQGMYYQDYRYYPDTGELKEESFIP